MHKLNKKLIVIYKTWHNNYDLTLEKEYLAEDYDEHWYLITDDNHQNVLFRKECFKIKNCEKDGVKMNREEFNKKKQQLRDSIYDASFEKRLKIEKAEAFQDGFAKGINSAILEFETIIDDEQVVRVCGDIYIKVEKMLETTELNECSDCLTNLKEIKEMVSKFVPLP